MAAKQISDTRYASFGRQDVSGRAEWKRECIEMVQLLKNTVCIAVWVPFNEGWGQFQTVSVTEMIRAEDRTRLIDSASGWYDQACGDFNSEHNYFRKLSVKKDPYDRIYVLSEYGGYAHLVEGHSFSDRIYGYKKFDSLFDWNAAVLPLFEETVRDLAKAGMAGAVYTQLSDVEDEVNGILTYDRKVCKLKKGLKSPID